MEIIIILLGVIIAQSAYLMVRVRPETKTRQSKVYVDTSVLMDGRIITVAETGFIHPKLVILKSVIAEMQYLADQADADKRARARSGLDVIRRLQDMMTVDVDVYDDGTLDEGGVDARLVELAKKNNGQLCTIDYNLNKVATINGIFVLNINELAQSIRMAFLPGETLKLQLTQKGQDSRQAVGYLSDGTMVVVENAAKDIGNTVEVEFIRSLQTAAGRMMFARPAVSRRATTSRQTIETGSRVTSEPGKSNAGKTRRGGMSSQGRESKVERSGDRHPVKGAKKSMSERRTSSSKEDDLISLMNEQ